MADRCQVSPMKDECFGHAPSFYRTVRRYKFLCSGHVMPGWFITDDLGNSVRVGWYFGYEVSEAAT